MARRPVHPRRSARQPGAALLLVVASIAVITALTLDLAYNTRVSVQLAANARDELRALYLAKSAANLGRLVLHFQQQLDGGSGPGRPGAGAIPGLNLGIRLWELVPLDSSTIGFLGGAPPGAGADSEFPAFGAFEGSFQAKVEDEERKVNVRQFDGTNVYAGTQAVRLAELLQDARWDFLFDRDDANGLRVSRKELFANLKDWIDIDETGSTFTGNAAQPFEGNYGDENALYDRLPERYKAKNAPFDSLDELYLVAGVSDPFMAAFGDRLTVYPDLNATINVNTDDPRELLLNAVAMGGGVLQPAMADPAFLEKLRLGLTLVRPFPFLALTPAQFAQVLTGLGVRLAPQHSSTAGPAAANTGIATAFGQRSSTFRIRATGKAGDVQRTLDQVVTFDRRAGGLEQDLGRVIHWHEE